MNVWEKYEGNLGETIEDNIIIWFSEGISEGISESIRVRFSKRILQDILNNLWRSVMECFLDEYL